jgi:hypothetical protein
MFLTLILLMWRIWWASNNASIWQMGFISAFKGLNTNLQMFFTQRQRRNRKCKLFWTEWHPSFSEYSLPSFPYWILFWFVPFLPVLSPLKEISWLLGMMPNLCFLFYYFLAPSGLCQPVLSSCCQWRFCYVCHFQCLYVWHGSTTAGE